MGSKNEQSYLGSNCELTLSRIESDENSYYTIAIVPSKIRSQIFRPKNVSCNLRF